MLRRLWSGFRWVIAGFVVLFLFRLGYGYAYPNGDGLLEPGSLREFTFARKNYASEKKMAAASMSVDQKYEKVASLSAHSDEYSEDERRLRALVPKHKALLQFEQSAGLSGRRTLDVAIGVPPAAFDAMVLDLRRIGRLQAIRVDKSDKTNEYRELQARRVSIEKTRDSLAKLRAAGGGRIEELLQLEKPAAGDRDADPGDGRSPRRLRFRERVLHRQVLPFRSRRADHQPAHAPEGGL